MTETQLTYSNTRQEIVEAAKSLFVTGVMSYSGHANLSARVSDDKMLLTIDGHIRDLRPDRLAVVGLNGETIEGALDPTNAEIVAMHTEIYKIRPDVGGIIHTHSPNLLAFALANEPLPCRYEALLRWSQATDVPVVPWAPRGSERSVGGIIETIVKYRDTQAVLLGNHGVLVFAPSPKHAASLVTILEEAATAELAARAIGGARDLPQGALTQVLDAMARVR